MYSDVVTKIMSFFATKCTKCKFLVTRNRLGNRCFPLI